MKTILLLALFACFLTENSAAMMQTDNGRYLFAPLTMEDGLPQNYVEDLMKDSEGFLWISTGGDGITRYDGYEFLTFNAFSGKTRLKNNFVLKFCEDRFGRIWAAGSQGLDILDVKRLCLVSPESLGEKFAAFSIRSASFVYCSSEGNMWMGADDGLYKLSFTPDGKVDTIVRICGLYLYNRSLGFCEVNGYIWFDHFGTLSMVKETASTPQRPIPVLESSVFPDRIVMLCLFHWQNDVWIGTNVGLYRYGINSRIMKEYIYDERDLHSLSQNYVTDINLTPDNTLLIGTLKGLNLYNALTDNFIRIQHEEGGFGLNNNFINCLLADENMVWIGTEMGGLNKMMYSRLQIRHSRYSSRYKDCLSGNLVNAVLEEEDGTLWVGTVEKGLNLRRKGKNSFEHYTTDPPSRMSHNSVSALASDGKDRLYVGTWGGGLGWISRSNLSDKTFHHLSVAEMPDLKNAFVSVLLYDTLNNVLWIGSSKEILVYDASAGKISDPFEGKRREDIVGSLGGCITGDGTLWMGTSAGLYCINLHSYGKKKLDYTLYNHKLDNPDENIIERITSVCPGRDGSVWIGTNGNGFYQAVKKGGACMFKAYTMADGLINNSVRGIWEDPNGRIWLTTNNGLSCFLPKEGDFQNYTRHDGLPGNQFYWNAIGGSADGTLYAGSTVGFLEIRPVLRVQSASFFPLAFTRLQGVDKELSINDGRVSFHESDKRLVINFASLDYNPSALACYSYRLQGFDDEWISLSADQHSVSYTNLSFGKYTFQLRYASDGKHFITPAKELSIEVKPYFFKTVWFNFLLVFAFLGVLWWRLRSLTFRQKLLQGMVEERTHELETQKRLLSDRTKELSYQNTLLKKSNEEITRQKDKILEMSHKVEELTFDKLAFFTNITHEFRTPLTLIIGPIERALKLSYNPQVIEQLRLVDRNSKYLLSLVNQLMDFRKVEEGRMQVVTNYGNLNRFLEELMPLFTDYACMREITFYYYVRLQDPYMIFAEDTIHKILTNLISNALKFTSKRGTVSVYAAVLSSGAEEMLYFGVRDTGKGIPETDLERIFDRFYQSDNQNRESVSGQSGTGIGLYLCRELVNRLKGRIYAKNNRAGGASFRVLVPVIRKNGKEDAKQEEEKLRPKIIRSRLSMLVVEDNKDMRDYIRSILNEYYNVFEAADGREALDVLKIRNIDFIISDLMMPVMDGVELSRNVKSDFSTSHIPFLMLTARTSDEARLESYRMGVDAYLLKPFDENMLLARISSILENRRRFQQKFSVEMDADVLEIEDGSGDKKFIERAMRVVKENYKNPDFGVSDFIRTMGISKSLLNKKMQSLTGQSAGQFMRNYRLNLARELLLRNKVTHAMNISEIAYEVGFNDPKYFTRCFMKHFNVTPSSLMEK